jgi:ABC-2 type transport system ATP-binding protein
VVVSNVIEMRGAGKTYHKGKVALVGVDLVVNEGEVIGLIGPNGAGKTTLIKLLLGLLDPTAGSVKLWGQESTALTRQLRERIGFLLDQRGLYTDLSVEENLRFWAKLYSVDSRKIEISLREWELWEERNSLVKQLSSGMSQRLSIARATLQDPSLLLLDEPTSQLDPFVRAKVLDLMSRLGAKNKTLLVTSHDLSGMERVCTRMILLRKGKIAADGSMSELARRLGVGQQVHIRYRGNIDESLMAEIAAGHNVHTEGSNTLVISGDAIDTGALVRLLVNHGMDIEKVEEKAQALEDIYVTIVKQDEER